MSFSQQKMPSTQSSTQCGFCLLILQQNLMFILYPVVFTINPLTKPSIVTPQGPLRRLHHWELEEVISSWSTAEATWFTEQFLINSTTYVNIHGLKPVLRGYIPSTIHVKTRSSTFFFPCMPCQILGSQAPDPFAELCCPNRQFAERLPNRNQPFT